MKSGFGRRSQSRRHVAATAIGLAVTCAVAACGSSHGGSSTTSGPAGSTGSQSISAITADLAKHSAPINAYPQAAAIPGGIKSLRGKTVWYIPLGGAVPLIATVGTGMQEALQAAGVRYHICDGKFVPTSISSCLSQAAQQHADAVVTSYIDYKLVPTAINQVVSQGIPVLVGGEAPPNGTQSSPKLAFDDTAAVVNLEQKLSMEQVIADSSGHAKIIYLGITDSPETKSGAAYAKEFVHQHCSGCSFKEVDYNTASLSRVPSLVSAALIANPTTTYVANESDSASQMTLQGIQSAGFSNKVKLAATNGDLDALQRIRDGRVQFVDVGASANFLGWRFSDAVLRMMRGRVPHESANVVRVFTKQNVHSLTLTPTAYATNNWYGSNAYQQGFRQAWGVSSR